MQLGRLTYNNKRIIETEWRVCQYHYTQHFDESESQATVLFLAKSFQNKTKIIIDEIVCHLFRYLYTNKSASFRF